MKKPFIVLLALLTIFLCACSPSTPPVTSQPRQTAPATSTLPAPTLPASTQGTTEEIPYRNDYFAQLLSHYHPSFQRVSTLSLSEQAKKDFRDFYKTPPTLESILSSYGIPWKLTRQGNEILLFYVLDEASESPMLFFRLEESADSLTVKGIGRSTEPLLLPEKEEALAPELSSQRSDLLAELLDTYDLHHAPFQKISGQAYSDYRDAWEAGEAEGSFGEAVDRLGAPWHAWEQDGNVRLLYRSNNLPDFTLVFCAEQDTLRLKEIQTQYVTRNDLTSETLQALKKGESTRKDVTTLLGLPHKILGDEQTLYHYLLSDGNEFLVQFDSDGLYTALKIVDTAPAQEE